MEDTKPIRNAVRYSAKTTVIKMMFKKVIHLLFHFAIAALFIRCGAKTKESIHENNESVCDESIIDSLDQISLECSLPDSLFALSHLKSTSVLNDIENNYFEAFLYDSIDSIPLKLFTPDQVQSLILELPLFRADSNMQEWIKGDWSIFFLAKQDKIADVVPIVLFVSGTDYGGMFLLVLDKNCHPLSLTELTGGECDGAVNCPLFESHLNANKIKTIEQRILGLSSTSILKIDSITYHKIILSNGQVELTQKDSSRIIKDRSQFDY